MIENQRQPEDESILILTTVCSIFAIFILLGLLISFIHNSHQCDSVCHEIQELPILPVEVSNDEESF